MADEENQEERAHWTVKNVPVETRKLAVACATKSGEPMWQWLVRAVRSQAAIDQGNAILPPGRPATPVHAMPDDMGQLSEMMRAAQAMAQAAGSPVPKTVARHAMALVNAQLRQARGLPAPKPKENARQTRAENGKTGSLEHETLVFPGEG